MNEETISVSVVTPFYNAEKTILDLLKCYSKQDIQRPWEIVFVDNRSTDNTCNLIHGYEGKLPPYKMVEAKEMPGAGYARNVGVDHCSFDNIAFCDADDEIPGNWVAKMLEGVERHGFIGCGIDDSKLNPPHMVHGIFI